jgi:beta-glucosidase
MRYVYTDPSSSPSSHNLAVFVGGLTPEWESEGFDRSSLDLPGRQAELIRALAKANPRTVVCLQAVSASFLPSL